MNDSWLRNKWSLCCCVVLFLPPPPPISSFFLSCDWLIILMCSPVLHKSSDYLHPLVSVYHCRSLIVYSCLVKFFLRPHFLLLSFPVLTLALVSMSWCLDYHPVTISTHVWTWIASWSIPHGSTSSNLTIQMNYWITAGKFSWAPFLI